MKRFIIKTLLFSAPILIAALTAEILLRSIPNDYSYKRAYLDKHAGEIETLILGSSHSFRGLNPEIFTGHTFNAGYVSQTLNIDYKILKKYEKNFDNLKTVILPISYHTFYTSLRDGGEGESWRVKNYVIYWGMDIDGSIFNHSEILTMRPKTNIKRLGSYYVIGTPQRSCSSLGWGRRDPKHGKDLIKTGKTTARKHTRADIHTPANHDMFANNKEILSAMINWCKERNIKIVLLTTPIFETYRQHINPEQYNITVETADQFASEYENCTYLNLFSDTGFVATDFHDADHLNANGAEKLSKLIGEKINESTKNASSDWLHQPHQPRP